jgi:hypothetical protein
MTFDVLAVPKTIEIRIILVAAKLIRRPKKVDCTTCLDRSALLSPAWSLWKSSFATRLPTTGLRG